MLARRVVLFTNLTAMLSGFALYMTWVILPDLLPAAQRAAGAARGRRRLRLRHLRDRRGPLDAADLAVDPRSRGRWRACSGAATASAARWWRGCSWWRSARPASPCGTPSRGSRRVAFIFCGVGIGFAFAVDAEADRRRRAAHRDRHRDRHEHGRPDGRRRHRRPGGRGAAGRQRRSPAPAGPRRGRASSTRSGSARPARSWRPSRPSGHGLAGRARRRRRPRRRWSSTPRDRAPGPSRSIASGSLCPSADHWAEAASA